VSLVQSIANQTQSLLHKITNPISYQVLVFGCLNVYRAGV